ncbi:hypothetical protein DIS24_g10179 [Lasiodiplodia hormozganensis]|uniref:DUF7730 domain-containing protein n=1 Tax=Lasiodiplodia hormozganensis TaxID=869390 RepID=A0AA39XPZ2_9PEZI|nr:hypothetical protein DIS24_g10179 [Lasiodiplodia hormozganensis]
MATQSSPFLRLPPEIRLMVYEELLLPPAPKDTRPQPSANPRNNDQSSGNNVAPPPPPPPPSRLHDARRTLQIRTVDPTSLSPGSPSSPSTTRPRYLARDPRHRNRTITTTYALLHNPGLHTSILRTCRQCYTEALPTLYAAHTFDFDTHVEAIVPFLSTLGCVARQNITSIAVVKRVLPAVGQEFDKAEWRAACAYVARELVVPRLRLMACAAEGLEEMV